MFEISRKQPNFHLALARRRRRMISIQTDIGQLGAVIYEVDTRKRCEFEPFKDADPSNVSSAGMIFPSFKTYGLAR